MAEIKAKARKPTSVELRGRVVGTINEFIARSERRVWLAAFASDQFHLVVDDEYRISILKRAAGASALFLFSVPLQLLGLDPWAIELGGGVKDAALDLAAQAVVRAIERPNWWVP
jgi:hypothetical protein